MSPPSNLQMTETSPNVKNTSSENKTLNKAWSRQTSYYTQVSKTRDILPVLKELVKSLEWMDVLNRSDLKFCIKTQSKRQRIGAGAQPTSSASNKVVLPAISTCRLTTSTHTDSDKNKATTRRLYRSIIKPSTDINASKLKFSKSSIEADDLLNKRRKQILKQSCLLRCQSEL